MKASPLLLAALLIILHLNLPSVNASVEEICKQVADAKGGDYNFCLKSLQSDPESCTTSMPSLTLIATKLAKGNFKSALATIKNLLCGNISDGDRSSLLDCSEVYGDGVSTLQKAIGAIRSGARNDVITYLSASLIDIGTCHDSFDEMATNKMLVAKVNGDASKISNLALQISTLM